MDRELNRAELDELLPMHALDALDGEERAQVERYLARDEAVRAELDSLREAISFLPPRDVRAPGSLWTGIEHALDSPTPEHSVLPLPREAPAPAVRPSHRGRRMVALLVAAAIVLAVAFGVVVVRQQDRIDDLAAEMHRDPIERQAMAALGSPEAHVVSLDAMHGGRGAAVVMLPNGTGYLMGHELPKLDVDSTYQLWAKVGGDDAPRMVSLGVLGREPGIASFRLAAAPMMFEVTREPASGSGAPGDAVVLRGGVA